MLTEFEILERIVSASKKSLSPDAARAFLELKFPPRETSRIRKLLQKNNSGTISSDERIALDKYLRVGQFLDLLHAKARISLSKAK